MGIGRSVRRAHHDSGLSTRIHAVVRTSDIVCRVTDAEGFRCVDGIVANVDGVTFFLRECVLRVGEALSTQTAKTMVLELGVEVLE